MQHICRLSLYLMAGLVALRTALYLLYASYQLPSPLETHPLEAEMVHLSWRVQTGLSLYPSWKTYPHVANFFSPLYFYCVGFLGKAFAADLDGLFLTGRLVTFSASLLTALGLGIFLKRRYGGAAALMGCAASLGASPLYGFGVMARPDVMADFLGLAGFMISRQPQRKAVLLGSAMLVAACLTKQTAGMYLIASLLASWLTPSHRRLRWLFAGSTTVLLGCAMLALRVHEPHSLRCLLEEGQTPFVTDQWLRTFRHLMMSSPGLLFFTTAGMIAWTHGRPRETDLAVLAFTILAVSLATSAKLGSDLNYYLGLRGVEAMALAKLWHSSATLDRRPRYLLASVLLVGALLMVPSVRYAEAQMLHKRQQAAYLVSANGRAMLEQHRRVLRLAERPELKLLTDSGPLALRQRERAPFVDPWLFRMLVNTGRVDPVILEERLRSEFYDALVLTADLYSSRPPYESYVFGLPARLVRAARGHYELERREAGFFIYRPTGESRSPRRVGKGRKKFYVPT